MTVTAFFARIQGKDVMNWGKQMKQFTIKLKSINEVKEFVRIVNDFPYDVDLSSGRYVVDAKSIMGIFSLDLAEKIEVSVHDEDAKDLLARLEKFFVS